MSAPEMAQKGDFEGLAALNLREFAATPGG